MTSDYFSAEDSEVKTEVCNWKEGVAAFRVDWQLKNGL